MPKPVSRSGGRVPDDPGKPSPAEAFAKARAAAGPRVAKAVEAATPKVEKAALSAGKLLGTLRDRAKITAKEFADAYKGEDGDDRPAGEPATRAGTDAATDAAAEPPAAKPRPRPRPRPE
jgi:hypothetical protein